MYKICLCSDLKCPKIYEALLCRSQLIETWQSVNLFLWFRCILLQSKFFRAMFTELSGVKPLCGQTSAYVSYGLFSGSAQCLLSVWFLIHEACSVGNPLLKLHHTTMKFILRRHLIKKTTLRLRLSIKRQTTPTYVLILSKQETMTNILSSTHAKCRYIALKQPVWLHLKCFLLAYEPQTKGMAYYMQIMG